MFSNIDISWGHNIMTSQYVLGRLWQEIAKNVQRKVLKCQFSALSAGGGSATRP